MFPLTFPADVIATELPELMMISMLVAASKSVTRREDPAGSNNKDFPDEPLDVVSSVTFASTTGLSSHELEKVSLISVRVCVALVLVLVRLAEAEAS